MNILTSKALRMARCNEGSHSFTMPPTRLSTNGISYAAFDPQPHSITALWPILSSRPTEGRRLSWPWWLVT